MLNYDNYHWDCDNGGAQRAAGSDSHDNREGYGGKECRDYQVIGYDGYQDNEYCRDNCS